MYKTAPFPVIRSFVTPCYMVINKTNLKQLKRKDFCILGHNGVWSTKNSAGVSEQEVASIFKDE
jgi:hypothetical protein